MRETMFFGNILVHTFYKFSFFVDVCSGRESYIWMTHAQTREIDPQSLLTDFLYSFSVAVRENLNNVSGFWVPLNKL